MRRDMNVTPEEKLLRLIKSKKTAGAKTTAKTRLFNLKNWRPFKKPGFRLDRMTKKLFGNLSNIVVFLIIAIIAYFLLDSFALTPYFRSRIDKIDLEPESAVVSEGSLPEEGQAPEKEAREGVTKPYDYYSKDITGRELFRPLVEKEGKVVEDEFKKIRENLSLIGIIAGGQLQAAIEDKLSGKTYFVYKGESVGDIIVEDVLENKVILNYKGQMFELLL